MVTTFEFHDRVAIVTGAGNGLGKSYALFLALKGAKVVVNDLGVSREGGNETKTSNPADVVVEEIIKNGGIAIANYDSVENGENIIHTAMNKWKRVDILVNNAGILRDVSLAKMSKKDWDLVHKVHLYGTFSLTKEVWAIMRNQNYGRIINITSGSGLFGNFGQTNYSSAKMGIVGFTKSLAKEVGSKNIKVNVIAPIAHSRMTENILPEDLLSKLKPELISPFVGYLAHEICQSNGCIFEIGGGFISKLRFQKAKGLFFNNVEDMTINTIHSRFKDIEDFQDGVTYPKTLNDSFIPILAKL